MNEVIEAETVTATENPLTAAQDVATVERGQPLATAQAEPPVVLNALLSLAKDPTLNIDVFDRLIALQERTQDRQAERAFNAAFVRMQAKMPTVKKDGSLEYPVDKNQPNGPKYLVSKFAKWETIEKAIRPCYTSEGFSLSFNIGQRTGDGGGLMVSAVLRHEAGHKEIGEPFPVPLDTSGGKNNNQAYGSSLSYGKKYSAFAALNIVTEGEDDDGVAAGARNLTKEQAADIKALVSEAEVDPKEWLASHLNYPVNQYLDILQEDYVRLKRALLSIKDTKEHADKQGMKL